MKKADNEILAEYVTAIMSWLCDCTRRGQEGKRRKIKKLGDELFVNEANRISYDTFSQLEVRTREKIWLDFNPVNEFWVHTELLKRDDVDFLKTNYLGNEALEENIIRKREVGCKE